MKRIFKTVIFSFILLLMCCVFFVCAAGEEIDGWYASAMGYCAAVLGYKVNIAYGKIASGYSMTGHGWTEIESGKKTYILDTVQERYSKGNFYMRSYSSYPKKLQKVSHKPIELS